MGAGQMVKTLVYVTGITWFLYEMTALLVRRARLEKLHLASIRAGYKYLFVEPGRIGKAKVKEG